MKKYILLTTTAMMLSTVVLEAYADSNSAQLDIMASFVAPFEIKEEQYLGFGVFLMEGANKTIIVTPDGKLDPSSTASMLSTSTFPNYGREDQYLLGINLGALNEAVFRIKGGIDISADISETDLNAKFAVNFSDTSVNLTDTLGAGNGANTCGTVSNFTMRFKPSVDGEFLLHIGGTFTTSDFKVSSICHGATTITLVLNEENLAQNGGL